MTYLKIFDEIRNAFAATVEARTRNYDASYFSFNLDAGRCSACQGDGCLKIDMQFLPDVYMKCGQCHGTPPSRRDSRRDLSRAEHRRGAGNDRPRGVHLLPWAAQGASPAEAADRRGVGLPPPGPARQHALRWRVAAAETGGLHVESKTRPLPVHPR